LSTVFLPHANGEDWTTTDGTIYNDVTIVSVNSDSVVIRDQNGQDIVSIKALPLKTQKKLRYLYAKTNDPTIPAYFAMNAAAKAKALAQQMHLPLAWICSFNQDLTADNPPPESESESLQMAIAALQSQAIVIFVAPDGEWNQSPQIVIDQLFHLDDGPLPDGHHFLTPKIVFSSPDVTTTFGRVSYTQMKATQEVAIDTAIDAIDNDSAAQAILNGQGKKGAAN
jgi:hypothetical protein